MGNKVENTEFTDLAAMKLAIQQARQGLGFVAPNPPVGCVILDRKRRLLATGYHRACGSDHAEIDALKKVTDPDQLRGAHLFVTLEPCAHQGRTPSCAMRLRNIPLGSVTYGMIDPNPLVSGKGRTLLAEAGIKIQELSALHEAISDLMEIYLHNVRTKSAFFGMKVAATLDGISSFEDPANRWITGKRSLEFVHYLRGCYDALLIGRGTFIHDNPHLNIRHPRFAKKENRVILIDPSGQCLETLTQSHLWQVHPPSNIFVIIGERRFAKNKKLSKSSQMALELGCQLLAVEETSKGLIDFSKLSQTLWERGISSVLVEGGGTTLSHLLEQSVARRFYLFMAPKIVGARSGKSWTSGFYCETLMSAPTGGRVRIKKLDCDLLVTGILDRP